MAPDFILNPDDYENTGELINEGGFSNVYKIHNKESKKRILT